MKASFGIPLVVFLVVSRVIPGTPNSGTPYGKDSHTIPILFPTTAGRGMTDHGDAYPGAA